MSSVREGRADAPTPPMHASAALWSILALLAIVGVIWVGRGEAVASRAAVQPEAS